MLRNYVTLLLSQKRTHKAERRRYKKRLSINKRIDKHRIFSSQFGRRSKVLVMFAKGHLESNVDRKGRVRFTIPKNFSVIEHPELTIRALSALAQEMTKPKIATIFLDFQKLSTCDLGANSLLDVLVDELATQARLTNRKIYWKGTYPVDQAHRRFMKAMGVIKRLKITHEYPTQDEKGKLTLFDKRCKHYVRAMRPKSADMKSVVSRKFADHFDLCLQSISRVLTPAAKGRLCQYVGEVIDNAEEHAGMLDWTIQGYLDTQLEIPMCEIVIFNFGKTIAQTFESLPESNFARLQVKNFIDLHKNKGFFNQGWCEEDLYTLIALQGGVSSKNTSTLDTRGNGTVDLIEFFQKLHIECGNNLGNQKTTMVVVSGATYVLFDGTYKMQETSSGKWIIAFNPTNDLSHKPDAKYIRHLDNAFFPGTLISVKFPMLNGDIVKTES